MDVGEFNRLQLWAPTSASRAISAVAELLVNFQIGSSDDIKQLIVDSTRLSALFHVLVFTRNTQEV